MAVEYCAKIGDRTALKRVAGALANEYILYGAPHRGHLFDC